MKTSVPLGIKKKPSAFSINEAFSKVNEKPETVIDHADEKLPSQHFSETDLQTGWQQFLRELQGRDTIVYNAINSFKLQKKGENTVEITYPTELAKGEFEKVSTGFFNHFMHKVNNFKITAEYRPDPSMKKEIITKRKIFDRFAEINPVLKDLDEAFKLDFN